MKLMYIYYNGLIPKVVTLEEAVQFLAQSVSCEGCSNPEKYASVVLSDVGASGNSSFELNDSDEMLLVVIVE